MKQQWQFPFLCLFSPVLKLDKMFSKMQGQNTNVVGNYPLYNIAS